MNLKDKLTPKNTEEVRPGLFVQARSKNPSSIEYRVVNPICWRGKYRWKNQFSWKNLIMIMIILFLTWSYLQETQFCRDLNEDPCEILPNITKYCFEKNEVNYGEGNYSFVIPDYSKKVLG